MLHHTPTLYSSTSGHSHRHTAHITPHEPPTRQPRPRCTVCGKQAGGGFRLCWGHLGTLLKLTQRALDLLTPEEQALVELATEGGIEA